MKLIVCRSCGDVLSLKKERKECGCGKSYGWYKEDGLHAVYGGPCTPLGFANDSFHNGILNQPEEGKGRVFTAFVIAKECKTFVKEEK